MSLVQTMTVTSVFLLTAFIVQVYPLNWNIAEKKCLDKIEKSKWDCHRTPPEIANKTALHCYLNFSFLECVDNLLAENCDRDIQNAIWTKSPFPMPGFNISDIKQFPECDKLIQWFDGKSGFLSSENSNQSSAQQNSVIGNSVLGNSVIGNSVIGNSVLGNSVLGNSVIGNSVIGNSVIGNSVIGNSVIGDSVIGNSVSNIFSFVLTQ